MELEEKTSLLYKRVEQSSYSTLIESDAFDQQYIQPTTLFYMEQQKEETIRRYVQQYALAESLTEVATRIKATFPRAVVQRELYTDPEEEGKKLYLTIIAPSLSRKEVLRKNRNLFKGWELAKSKDFNAYINITARTV